MKRTFVDEHVFQPEIIKMLSDDIEKG